ncbi:MAG: hypothetical protein LBV12_12695 [Puniceicoccales bacterium]|nr:hypothetical protein [Puniceicoccales bacterium]
MNMPVTKKPVIRGFRPLAPDILGNWVYAVVIALLVLQFVALIALEIL